MWLEVFTNFWMSAASSISEDEHKFQLGHTYSIICSTGRSTQIFQIKEKVKSDVIIIA